ncbi:hypothetical protein LXL04_016106 [Taraxacum kok-saghyz]
MAELECPSVMSKLIAYLSSLLQQVAKSNDLNPHLPPQKISAFHALTRPTISIQSYLERIFKYANCSPSCYVIAYVYLDRFTQRQPALSINSFNVHRLLITSVMIAAKFMDDIIRGLELELEIVFFRIRSDFAQIPNPSRWIRYVCVAMGFWMEKSWRLRFHSWPYTL